MRGMRSPDASRRASGGLISQIYVVGTADGALVRGTRRQRVRRLEQEVRRVEQEVRRVVVVLGSFVPQARLPRPRPCVVIRLRASGTETFAPAFSAPPTTATAKRHASHDRLATTAGSDAG